MLQEITLKTEYIYRGRILNLRKDHVQIANDQFSIREIVEHHPAVVILAVEGDQMILVKQYRIAIGKVLLEAAAGLIDDGEDPLEAAKRELREETGYTAQKWTYLSSAYSAPGFCEELLHYYLAEELTPGETDLDEDEFVEVRKLSLAEMETMLDTHQIEDIKTIAIYFLARRVLAARGNNGHQTSKG